MADVNQPLLVNILGHAAGALIFAIFLVLLHSGRGWSGPHGRYLPALAAALSLTWNLGSLVAIAWPGLPPATLSIVAALSFSVLSLLPAVLLHVSLAGTRHALMISGYVLSSTAIAMHLWEVRGNGTALHQSALLVITIGFLLLALAAAVAPAAAKRSGGFRILASMCLALFATSFVHFGSGHAGQAWSSELVIHHAGIPLALFVLLQDYRFVLLDAFVRFLANALLAAVLSGLFLAAEVQLRLVERAAASPQRQSVLLIMGCLLLVSFAGLRSWIQRWLTGAVFRRGALAHLASRVKDRPPFTDEEPYIQWASGLMAEAVRTNDVAIADPPAAVARDCLRFPVLTNVLPQLQNSPQWNWAEAVVPVRLGPADLKLILLGRRRGGQRYLGEDLEALASASTEISEWVESLRRQEMDRLAAQAELRALQSQINPHFLFNALNTLYGCIPRASAEARRTVLHLADIFRYFLQSERTFMPLAEEMQIVRAYLEVEQLRLGDRLRVDFAVDAAAGEVYVPVLSIQPLVENAIKHGVAPRAEPGYVKVSVSLESDRLRIAVENSGGSGEVPHSGAGVGLRNVRRRLEICYGTQASLNLQFHSGRTVAEVIIPRDTPAAHRRQPTTAPIPMPQMRSTSSPPTPTTPSAT